MKSVRILLVEDDAMMMRTLHELYDKTFRVQGYACSFDFAAEAEVARAMVKAEDKPYDFVSLDVDLRDQSINGLDVLKTIGRFASSWVVALLTGVESSASIDQTMGWERAEALRRRLRPDAYAVFPAERLLVVEKPSVAGLSADSLDVLRNRIRQIVFFYDQLELQRYIFRPINVVSLERVPGVKGKRGPAKFVQKTEKLWQIRFNRGELRTLPNTEGFETLRYFLAGGPPITAEQAAVLEPKAERVKSDDLGLMQEAHDPFEAYFAERGLGWRELSPAEQTHQIKVSLSSSLKRYIDLRSTQDQDDLSAAEEVELESIKVGLGPLNEAAEAAYRKEEGLADDDDERVVSQGEAFHLGLSADLGDKIRPHAEDRGKESKAAERLRTRFLRSKDRLARSGFSELAAHLNECIERYGTWYYRRPEPIEWNTGMATRDVD